ncbi:MAG TPA: OmpH family outer membrane protein [Pyrinomonadaceae bacterium]|jgi:outer membrane protein|nr:OmpH family outer membrane protein [Pyrinomonadaceae bacterium]
MKRIFLLLLATLLLAAPCPAQTTGKIAFIDTSAFNDPYQGIKRLVRAVEGVDKEFAARLVKLTNDQWRLQQRVEQIPFFGPIPVDPRPMTPLRKKDVIAKGETMKREFERQRKELEDAFNRRTQEVLSPIYDDITKSMESFARQRGITLLIDSSRTTCCVGDCRAMRERELDVTQEFISEYNRLNP